MPTQPTFTWTEGEHRVPVNDYQVSYGATTADGTDQASMTNLGMLGPKIKCTGIFNEEPGVIYGGFGRGPVGLFAKSNIQPMIEGTVVGAKLADVALLLGRVTSEVTSSGVAPNVQKQLGLSRATPYTWKYWQTLVTVPAPYGEDCVIQFFKGAFESVVEPEWDKGADALVEWTFRIRAMTDAGAKANSKDPWGYIFDTGQPS